MTLPQNVKDAVVYVDGGFDDCDNVEWRAIRAHLLNQDAEIERLREDRDSHQRAAIKAESRLAAANALLREIGKMADGTLCDEVRDYLQGAGDEA